MDIGSRLRSLRESKGMTQEEVGKRIGVTKATVNRYETGEIDIKRTIAIKLADILDTTPSYIMGWDDAPGKIDVKSSPSYIGNSQVDPDALAIKMYKSLDSDDKAEIRGEMKQMLKADKYKKENIENDTEFVKGFDIAASGGAFIQSGDDDFETL